MAQLLNSPTTDKHTHPTLIELTWGERHICDKKKYYLIFFYIIGITKKILISDIWQQFRDWQITRVWDKLWFPCQLLRFYSAPLAVREPVPPARPLPPTPRAWKDNVLDDIQISLTLDWEAHSPEGQVGQDNIIFSSSRLSARLRSANSGGWNPCNVKCHTENLQERSEFLLWTHVCVNTCYREHGGVFAHSSCAGVCLFTLIFKALYSQEKQTMWGWIILVPARVLRLNINRACAW